MELAWKIFAGLTAVIIGLVGLVYRHSEKRHDGHERKLARHDQMIRDLAADSVTRDTIIRIENDWKDDVALLRQEAKEKHLDNRAWQARIEGKLDEMNRLLVEYARGPR